MFRNSIIAVTLVLAGTSACKDRGDAAADSELARDLALVGQTPAYPQFRDTALTTAPDPEMQPVSPRTTPTTPSVRRRTTAQPPRRVSEPATTVVERPAPPPAAAPATRGFQAGTSFALTTRGPVCTTNLPGDKITATLTEPVHGENGAYMPEGTVLVLEVASVTPGDTPESAQISLRVRSILLNDQPVRMEGNVAILSALERREVPRDRNSDRKKVVTGAIAGAILGQIMGKDTKSTVIGAAAGAAAGTAASVASRKYDACLPAGGGLRVTTSQQIVLSD